MLLTKYSGAGTLHSPSSLTFFLLTVFVSIRRRQFELVKAAVPVILNVLKAMSLNLDDEDTDPQDLFHIAINIADSIEAICMKLVCDTFLTWISSV